MWYECDDIRISRIEFFIFMVIVIVVFKQKPKTSSATLREESSQTNVILQYKLLAAILSAVCSVIQQS